MIMHAHFHISLHILGNRLGTLMTLIQWNVCQSHWVECRSSAVCIAVDLWHSSISIRKVKLKGKFHYAISSIWSVNLVSYGFEFNVFKYFEYVSMETHRNKFLGVEASRFVQLKAENVFLAFFHFQRHLCCHTKYTFTHWMASMEEMENV